MSTQSYTIPSARPSAPTYLVQVTTLGETSKQSRMIWVGTADGNGEPASRRLGADWACAMPTRLVSPCPPSE